MRKKTTLALGLLVLLGLTGLRCSDLDPPRSGPMVQRVSATSAVVLLHRVAPARGRLAYRAGDGDEEHFVRVETASKRLRFALEGLAPSTRYAYRVELDAAEGEPAPPALRGVFKTAPEPGRGRVRFAAFGDSGKIPWWTKYQDRSPLVPRDWLQSVLPGRGHQWEVGARVLEGEPDLVLHLGDIVYPVGAREHYNEGFFEPFEALLARVPMWATIGNHDLITENAQPVLDFFDLPGAQRYYDFAHGPVHFFCVDTFTTAIDEGSPQRAWLEAALRAARATPWRVVFTHRPFLTVSRSAPDPDNKRGYEQLHPLFAQYGVALVLSGHDHNYQRFAPRDGVHYIIAGGGGKSLYEHGEAEDLAAVLRDYSFARAEADAQRLSLQGVDEDGEVFDTLELEASRYAAK